MRLLAITVAAIAVGLTGCSVGDGDGDETVLPGGERQEAQPRAGESGEAKAIREWSAALNREDYEKAASYFAQGAIVEQVQEMRLADSEAAVAFNRSLPCKADVTDVKEAGGAFLVAFRLRGGPGGGCDGGSARVRFVFEDGKFSEWRQLPQAPQPEGDIA